MSSNSHIKYTLYMSTSCSPRALANILSFFFAQHTWLTISFYLHHVSFSSYISNPFFRSPFSIHVLPSSLQLESSVSLLSLSNQYDAVPLSRVEVWQRCESECASRVLGPRGVDCGKILMPLTTPFADENDGAQLVATGAGTSSRDFLLSRSKRVSPTWRKTYH